MSEEQQATPISDMGDRIRGIEGVHDDQPAGAIERSEAVRSMTPQELVEAYPDMRQEAGVIAAADAFASEKIGSANDQSRFTAAIRDQVAERVAEGEQFADMNIKEERAIERSGEATQESSQAR